MQIRSAPRCSRILHVPHLHVTAVLQTEAYDDTRIAPFGRPQQARLAAAARRDSIARWDGDVLEIDTTDNDPQFSTHGIVTVKKPRRPRDRTLRTRLGQRGRLHLYHRRPGLLFEAVDRPVFARAQPLDKMYEFACHGETTPWAACSPASARNSAAAAKK